MKTRWMITVVLALSGVVLGLEFLAAQPTGSEAEELVPVEKRTGEGIPYLSGGVGIGEREDLRELAETYNLKLIFALREGKYLALIDVHIEDGRGNPVLETKTQGPWLFATLPQGTYTVRAVMGGERITREIQVEEREITEVPFFW